MKQIFRNGMFLSIVFLFTIELSNAQCTFNNPIMEGADPFAFFHEGYYYLLVTRGDRIGIKRSAKLENIGPLMEINVWNFKDTPVGGHVWAPEMYFMDDNWYIYSCGQNTGLESNPEGVAYVQEDQEMFVLQSITGDPFGPYVFDSWLMKGYGAIDETIFTHTDGKKYIIWSQFNIPGQPQTQCLYIAELINPRTIGATRIQISCPDQQWELNGWPVNEGAAVLQKNGKTYVVYSGSGYTTREYALGYMVNNDGDLLNPGSWTKVGPVFQQNPAGGVYSTGHNSFTTSPDGTEDWIVYHGRLTTDGSRPRKVFMQKFTWEDDVPQFGKPIPLNENITCPSDTGWIISAKQSVPEMITIYPNPADQYLHIEIPDITSSANLKVINLMGQTIIEMNFDSEGVNVSELSEGIYFINISTGEHMYQGHFIKLNS